MKQIRSLMPVSSEGLDKLAAELLNENIQVNDNVQAGNNPPKNPKDYIILETADSKDNKIGLYVAKTKEFFNKNWYEAHEALAKENSQMLTIRQGIDLIKLLKSGKVYDGLKSKLNDAEIVQLLNEIAEVRSPWRAEWLDGRFVQKDDEWHLLQGHKYNASKSGKLEDKIIAGNNVKINPIIKNFYFNINDADKYGLPTKEGKGLYYWHPTNESVARFLAYSDGAGLNCNRVPSNSYSDLWVRRAKIKG